MAGGSSCQGHQSRIFLPADADRSVSEAMAGRLVLDSAEVTNVRSGASGIRSAVTRSIVLFLHLFRILTRLTARILLGSIFSPRFAFLVFLFLPSFFLVMNDYRGTMNKILFDYLSESCFPPSTQNDRRDVYSSASLVKFLRPFVSFHPLLAVKSSSSDLLP